MQNSDDKNTARISTVKDHVAAFFKSVKPCPNVFTRSPKQRIEGKHPGALM